MLLNPRTRALTPVRLSALVPQAGIRTMDHSVECSAGERLEAQTLARSATSLECTLAGLSDHSDMPGQTLAQLQGHIETMLEQSQEGMAEANARMPHLAASAVRCHCQPSHPPSAGTLS